MPQPDQQMSNGVKLRNLHMMIDDFALLREITKFKLSPMLLQKLICNN